MTPVLRVLTAYRAFAGAGLWVAPGLAARLFGFARDEGEFYVDRLAAVRELGLGVGAAVAADASARRLWLRVGLACDALDTIAALLGRARGYLTPREATVLAIPTAVSLALTAVALCETRHSGAPRSGGPD